MPDEYASSRIKSFRSSYPQYNDIPDDVFIEGMRKQYVPDSNPEEFVKFFLDTYADAPEERGVLSSAGTGLVAGVGDVASSMGGAYDWLTGAEDKGALTKWGEEVSRENAPDEDLMVSITDQPEVLLNPRWWAYNLGRLTPFIATSIVPSAGGATLAAKAFQGVKWAGAIGGGLTGGAFESVAEAGSARNQALEMGKTPEEADAIAEEVMGRNFILNSIVQSIQVGKVLKYTGTPVTKEVLQQSVGAIVKDLAFEGITESGQEGLQNIISNVALGIDPFEGLAESAVLGFAGGTVFGGGLEIIEGVSRRARNKLNAPPSNVPQGNENDKPISQRYEVAPGTGVTFNYQRGQKYAELIEKMSEEKPESAKALVLGMYNTLTNNGNDKEVVEGLAYLRSAATDKNVAKYNAAVAGLYGDAIAEAKVDKKFAKELLSRMPKNVADKLNRLAERETGAVSVTKPSSAEEAGNPTGTTAAPASTPAKPSKVDEMFKAFRQEGKAILRPEFQALSYKEKWELLRRMYNMTPEQETYARKNFVEATAKLLDMTPEDYLAQIEAIFPSKNPADVTQAYHQEEKDEYPPIPRKPDELKWEGNPAAVPGEISNWIGDKDNPYAFVMDDVWEGKVTGAQGYIEGWSIGNFPDSPTAMQAVILALDGKSYRHLETPRESGPSALEQLEGVSPGITERMKTSAAEMEQRLAEAKFVQSKAVFQGEQLDRYGKAVLHEYIITDRNSPAWGANVSVLPSDGIYQVAQKIRDKEKLFAKGSSETFSQGTKTPRGAITFLDNGAFVLAALEKGDFSTFLHEVLYHVRMQNFVTPEEKVIWESHFGKSFNQLTKEDIEKGASLFESWLAGAKNPPKGLERVFAKIREFMLEIYNNAKERIGLEVSPNIEKVFNSWIDRDAKKGIKPLAAEILTGGRPIAGNRIIGSMEDIDPARAIDLQAQLTSIGYKSVMIVSKEGRGEILYYINETPSVQEAIQLRQKEIRAEFSDTKEYAQAIKKLGRAFGLSKEAISSQLNELQLTTDENYHSYYEGTTYTRTRDVEGREGKKSQVKEIYKVVKEDNNSVTLEEIAGDLYWKKVERGIPPFTATIAKAELEKSGYAKKENDRVRTTKPLPRGRSAKRGATTEAVVGEIPKTSEAEESPTATSEPAIVEFRDEDEDLAGYERAVGSIEEEIFNSNTEEVEGKERAGGVGQSVRQDISQEGAETVAGALVASGKEQTIRAKKMIEPSYQRRLAELDSKMLALAEEMKTVDRKKNPSKHNKLYRDYLKLQAEQDKILGTSEKQERPPSEKEVEEYVKADPDNDSPMSADGVYKLPSGVETFIKPEERTRLYEHLQMSKKMGDMYSDEQLMDMLKNSQSDQSYEQSAIDNANLLLAFTVDLVEDFNQAGIDASKSGHTWASHKWIEDKLFAMGLDSESTSYYRDKIYAWIGMPQVLARYNPSYFGKVFHTVDDGRKISANEANQLLFANPSWTKLKNKSKEYKLAIWKVLLEGTMATNTTVSLPNAPQKPWEVEKWGKITDWSVGKTEEEITQERGRRQKAREDYLGVYSVYYAQKREVDVKSRGKVYTYDELVNTGITTRFGDIKLTREQANDYFEIRAIAEKTSELWKKGHIANGMTPGEAAIVFGLTGYIPLDRGHGKFVFAYRDETSPTKRGWARFKSYKEATDARNALVAEGRIDPSSDLHNIKRISDYTPSLISQHNITPSDVVELIGEIGIPAGKIYRNKNLRALVEKAQEKSYRGRRSIRRGYVGIVPNTNTMEEVFEEWVVKTSNQYAASITRTKLNAELGSIKPKGANRSDLFWRKFADEYVAQAFSPVELQSGFWDGVRRTGFLWALAGNVSNALLNLTQPFATVPAFLYQGEWGMKFGEVERAFIDGISSAVYYNRPGEGHGTLPKNITAKYPMLADALAELRHSGVISASYYENLVNSYQGKDKILAIAGFLQSMTEVQNRLSSVITGYVSAQEYLIPRARGNEKVASALSEVAGLSTAEMEELALSVSVDKRLDAIEARTRQMKERLLNGTLSKEEAHFIATRFARRTSDETQFIFGKHNLPYYVRANAALQNPLKAGFLFRGFLFNYAGFLLTLTQSGRITPLSMGAAILPLLALTGITGMPFGDDLKEALKSLGIIDTDTALRKAIKNDTVSDLILKGVPSILPDEIAFDMSRRAGAGQILPSGLTRGNFSDAISDMFAGAPFSMSGRIMEGFGDLLNGNTDAAYRKITPIAVGNIIKAVQYSNEGAKSSRGNLLVDKNNMSNPATLGITGLGFKPAKVAKAEDYDQALKYLTANRQDMIETFNTRMANAIQSGDKDEVADVLHDIMTWNSRAKNRSEFYRLKEQMRNIKRRIKLGTLSSAESTQVPKSLRPEAYELSQTYNMGR